MERKGFYVFLLDILFVLLYSLVFVEAKEQAKHCFTSFYVSCLSLFVSCLSFHLSHLSLFVFPSRPCVCHFLTGGPCDKQKKKKKRRKKKASPAFQTVFGGRTNQTSERDRYAVGFVSFLFFAFAFFFLLSLDKKTWRALSLKANQPRRRKEPCCYCCCCTISGREKKRDGVSLGWHER